MIEEIKLHENEYAIDIFVDKINEVIDYINKKEELTIQKILSLRNEFDEAVSVLKNNIFDEDSRYTIINTDAFHTNMKKIENLFQNIVELNNEQQN